MRHTFTLTHRDQGHSESRCLVSSLFIATWSITKPMWYIQSPWHLVYKRLLGMNIQSADLSGTHESVLLMSFYNSEQTVSPAVYTCNTWNLWICFTRKEELGLCDYIQSLEYRFIKMGLGQPQGSPKCRKSRGGWKGLCGTRPCNQLDWLLLFSEGEDARYARIKKNQTKTANKQTNKAKQSSLAPAERSTGPTLTLAPRDPVKASGTQYSTLVIYFSRGSCYSSSR